MIRFSQASYYRHLIHGSNLLHYKFKTFPCVLNLQFRGVACSSTSGTVFANSGIISFSFLTRYILTGKLELIKTCYTNLWNLRASSGQAVFIAVSPTEPSSIVRPTLQHVGARATLKNVCRGFHTFSKKSQEKILAISGGILLTLFVLVYTSTTWVPNFLSTALSYASFAAAASCIAMPTPFHRVISSSEVLPSFLPTTISPNSE